MMATTIVGNVLARCSAVRAAQIGMGWGWKTVRKIYPLKDIGKKYLQKKIQCYVLAVTIDNPPN
jgi:hypothetical protein